MNPNAMMKQFQNLQKEVMREQEKINNTVFTGESSLVKVEVKGTKELKSVKIDREAGIDLDDLEAVEDMIVLAVNDAMKKIDKETENKLGKYTSGIPGLF
ncbi:MAG: YbaB/EbfC family nucleoid-associated protein [Bacilli bacterium]|nr:YbaB/EbfC family nucleoid-associated protein [Bacilli bacterium]